MQRYFILNNNDLSKDDIFHITNVMRMNIDDKFEIVKDNKVFVCKIISSKPNFDYKIIEEINENNELDTNIRLLYCIPKGEKIDLVIQKAVELGVNEIILVNSSRCVAKIDTNNKEKKLIRFNKIIKEASEQSKRTKLMKLEKVIDFKDIEKYNADLNLIAYEKEETDQKNILELIKDYRFKTINILIGAEGGFSKEEVDFALKSNYHSISLGKRILRSETACFYILSILSFYFGINNE